MKYNNLSYPGCKPMKDYSTAPYCVVVGHNLSVRQMIDRYVAGQLELTEGVYTDQVADFSDYDLVDRNSDIIKVREFVDKQVKSKLDAEKKKRDELFESRVQAEVQKRMQSSSAPADPTAA